MIIARCPACQTVFRARPEQLSAHGGRVRCGHCLKPFNALDNLVVNAQGPAISDIDNSAGFDAPPEYAEPPRPPLANAGHGPQQPDPTAFFDLLEPPRAAPAPAPAPAPARQSLSLSLSPWILEEKTPDSARPGSKTIDDGLQTSGEKHPTTFERMGDRLDFVVPDEFTPSRKKGSEERAATSIHTPFLDGLTGDVSRMEGTSHLELPVAASADASFTQKANANTSLDDGAKAAPVDMQERSVKAETAGVPSEMEISSSAVIRRRIPQLAEAVTPERHSPEAVDAVEEGPPSVSHYAHTHASPGRRWLMGLAIGILLGTLSAQIAYNFRVDITRNWPQLRPLYLELCAQFGCELPLPRVAAAIRITSSSLESDPTEPTRFVLNASIANQARHPLALPHLELTLTDNRDRSIVRRVLSPDEWTRGSDTSAGMAIGEEIVTSLAFSAPDLFNATGYRVYAFYP